MVDIFKGMVLMISRFKAITLTIKGMALSFLVFKVKVKKVHSNIVLWYMPVSYCLWIHVTYWLQFAEIIRQLNKF